jgi:hypothetical protein
VSNEIERIGDDATALSVEAQAARIAELRQFEALGLNPE